MSSLNSNSILEVNTLISLISQFMGNFLGKSFYLMILKTKFVKKSQKNGIMINRFSFENMLSFKEPQEFSLKASAKKERLFDDSQNYVENAKDVKTLTSRCYMVPMPVVKVI